MSDYKDEVKLVAERLIKAGYGGLYYPGECACCLTDLAPCGESPLECEYGFKHTNPKDTREWIVSKSPEPPTEEQWDKMPEF